MMYRSVAKDSKKGGLDVFVSIILNQNEIRLSSFARTYFGRFAVPFRSYWQRLDNFTLNLGPVPLARNVPIL